MHLKFQVDGQIHGYLVLNLLDNDQIYPYFSKFDLKLAFSGDLNRINQVKYIFSIVPYQQSSNSNYGY